MWSATSSKVARFVKMENVNIGGITQDLCSGNSGNFQARRETWSSPLPEAHRNKGQLKQIAEAQSR